MNVDGGADGNAIEEERGVDDATALLPHDGVRVVEEGAHPRHRKGPARP
jgi:hypothetical protein